MWSAVPLARIKLLYTRFNYYALFYTIHPDCPLLFFLLTNIIPKKRSFLSSTSQIHSKINHFRASEFILLSNNNNKKKYKSRYFLFLRWIILNNFLCTLLVAPTPLKFGALCVDNRGFQRLQFWFGRHQSIIRIAHFWMKKNIWTKFCASMFTFFFSFF